MKSILPSGLKRGDTIGVVAPAGIVDRTSLRRGVQTLQQMGFRVKLGAHVLARSAFFAGDHRARLADLNSMIRDESVQAIFCARGGYGSVYLIHGLDYKTLQRRPKIVMGASDLTVLLNHVYSKTGLITFHGPMVATNFSQSMAAIHLDSFYRLLMRERGRRTGRWAILLHARGVLNRGIAHGRLVGGCLSLLVSTLGTPYEIDTEGSILFIEDVNEPPFRLDRMLRQMLDAGKLGRVQGLIFGDMLNCIDPMYSGVKARQIIEKLLSDFKHPLIMGLSSGHTRHPLVTLPVGARVSLDTRSHPQLIIEQRTTR